MTSASFMAVSGVARQRRCDLPCRHQQGEVPRDDLAGHAHGLHAASGKSVFELIRPSRVVEKVRGGERHVDVACLADRFATIERLDRRKLAGTLLDDARYPVDVLAAIRRLHARPRAVVCLAGRFHCLGDIGVARKGDA
jgi:hypothetical protein